MNGWEYLLSTIAPWAVGAFIVVFWLNCMVVVSDLTEWPRPSTIEAHCGQGPCQPGRCLCGCPSCNGAGVKHD